MRRFDVSRNALPSPLHDEITRRLYPHRTAHVVIAIIAVLASIALPVLNSPERGSQTKDLSNAKQIALACKLFAADNDGNFRTKMARPPILRYRANFHEQIQPSACLPVPDYLPAESSFI
jgi:hypothetical protein